MIVDSFPIIGEGDLRRTISYIQKYIQNTQQNFSDIRKNQESMFKYNSWQIEKPISGNKAVQMYSDTNNLSKYI